MITATALELVRQEGLEAVTLRKVAQRLETGPASLYVYVTNREELLERMLDRALSEVPAVPVARAKWRERLVELFNGMLEALNRYPGIAQVGLGSVALAPSELAITENALALFHAGKVPEQAVAWACDALMLYTFSNAVEYTIEHRRTPSAPQHKSPDIDFAGYARELYASLPEDRYPHLRRMADTMTSGTDIERFEFGLYALIDGARTS